MTDEQIVAANELGDAINKALSVGVHIISTPIGDYAIDKNAAEDLHCEYKSDSFWRSKMDDHGAILLNPIVWAVCRDSWKALSERVKSRMAAYATSVAGKRGM